MAKNEVTLTFAGDTAQIEKAFDSVGSSAKDMSSKVDSASKDVGDSFDRVGEAADTVDTRAMGFRDTLTGIQDTATGFKQVAEGDIMGGLFTLGMGIGDLASGVANFGVQFAKTAAGFIKTQARMVAVHLVNAGKMALGWLIAMGPIALIVAAVVALAVIIIKNWDRILAFSKRIWRAVWEWIKDMWQKIKEWVGTAIGRIADIFFRFHPLGIIIKNWKPIVGWIKDTWNGVIGWLKGLPARISSATSGMWDGIATSFKAALNWVIGKWNSLSFTIPSFSAFGQTIGGGTISVPRIPYFHTGGVMGGAPGTEGLAMLRAGERIIPEGQTGNTGATVLEIRSGGSRLDDLLVEILRRSIRAKGGNVQAVLGTAS